VFEKYIDVISAQSLNKLPNCTEQVHFPVSVPSIADFVLLMLYLGLQ